MNSDSNGGGAPGKGKGVVIQSFPTRIAADLAKARLEANGIACWTAADDAGGFFPNLALSEGVRLFVLESDVQAAQELLDLPPSPADPNPGVEENPPTTTASPSNKFSVGEIIIGIILGILGTLLYQHLSHSGTHTYYHHAAEGKIDEKWVYIDGHLHEHDNYDADGKIEDTWIYAGGQLREHLRDRNHDGKFDEWIYYESNGTERSECDNNFDGKPDEWWYYSNGDLLTMEKDSDFNGVPDEFYTYKNSIPQEGDIRPNGSKFVTMREVYVDGVLTERWLGGDSNGDFKEIIRYDPFSEPVITNSGKFHLLSEPSDHEPPSTNH